MKIVEHTPAYARTTPRVSVLSVAVHGHEREAVEALASVAASVHVELELLMVGQLRSDSGLRGFLHDHPALPAALLQQPMDYGLGRSLNALVERARGEYLFMLDARGGIYPSTLQRLVMALDADPHAFFAYPMVAMFAESRPVELRSSLPWEPERLKSGNWIDATALIRRRRLLQLGRFSTDAQLAGFEAFDLWCKCAEAGGHGVQVPQVLAWRRRPTDQVPACYENGTPAMWALMRQRFPQLLA